MRLTDPSFVGMTSHGVWTKQKSYMSQPEANFSRSNECYNGLSSRRRREHPTLSSRRRRDLSIAATPGLSSRHRGQLLNGSNARFVIPTKVGTPRLVIPTKEGSFHSCNSRFIIPAQGQLLNGSNARFVIPTKVGTPYLVIPTQEGSLRRDYLLILAC